MGPGRNRGWLLRLVIAFGFAQGAVSMARPAVSYRALALGADERAIGVIAGVLALLPLFAAVPLGRRTDHGRCAPLLPVGVVLIAGGCALSGTADSLVAMAAWSGVMGLGHLCFVVGAQSIVARQSAPREQVPQLRPFHHRRVPGPTGRADRRGPSDRGPGQGGQQRAGPARGGRARRGVVHLALAHRAPYARRVPYGSGRPCARAPHSARPGRTAGILISLSVLSATDILTAYLPVVGEHRGIAPSVIGLLLSLRAAATIACRLVMTPMLRLLGRAALLTATCLVAGVLCAGLALPVPVWALAAMLLVLGFCLGVGQPLSMTTVVQAAPDEARSTALALRLTGNRLGRRVRPRRGWSPGPQVWPRRS